MFDLLVKCAALIVVIHGLRVVCRRIGPRFSGLLLGLPSSTAMVLFVCGRERGVRSVAEMAEASLLGLVAAVTLPLVYAQAVRWRWPLSVAVGASVAGYFIAASALGSFDHGGPAECLGIALGAILLTSVLSTRVAIPTGSVGRVRKSSPWLPLVRLAVPIAYVFVVAVASESASPSWAGLVSTFPSMSTVLLIVTHLEEGPAEASRIARSLPSANLSTAAFLAAFRFGCPLVGPAWAMIIGYGAALTSLTTIELLHRRDDLVWLCRSGLPKAPSEAAIGRPGPFRPYLRTHVRSAPVARGRHRPARRKRFAPRLEALPC
jgi:hypothetical protein